MVDEWFQASRGFRNGKDLFVRGAVKDLSVHKTHMGEHFLHQFPVLGLFPSAVKHADPPTTSQAVTGHFQLVHRVDVLNMEFPRWTVGRA